ncbi:MAG: aminopeptidase [Desulfococcus sp. 4484_241]|nr:MAG: aminopeptidase [Desulfococcus sp. 4484_241]
MFTQKQLERYADVLLWGLFKARTRPFEIHDIIVVRYDLDALPLAEIVYHKLVASGKQVVVRAGLTPTMEKLFYRFADDEQLLFVPPGEKELIKKINGNITLLAPGSLTHLGSVDPAKIGKVAMSRKALRDILDKRENSGEFSWTLCIYPTAVLARHARISRAEYARQIIRACFLDKRDAVGRWETIFQQALSVKKWLNSLKIEKLHIESDSIDLEITPGEKRKWIGISGHNIPSFEIFLSPDWRGTQGVYFADMPSYRNGNLVSKLKVEFKNGVAVKIRAEKGESFARTLTATDDGAARLGEFSLTDKRFSRINRFMANTLFDENFGGRYGNCHVALGASYLDTFAGNPSDLKKTDKRKLGFNESAIHWDIVNTEKKRVTAILKSGKKKTIYENGVFAC